MINFPHTRQRRISVRLKELTLGEAVALCKLPGQRYELTNTELLRNIAKDADQPRPAFVTDPLLMTVEERTLLVVIYLAHVTVDGPDFSVGDSKLSDYVDFTRDSTHDETDLGMVNEKEFVLRPLLGVHVQALELLCHNRGDWIVGAMAARLFKKGEALADWAALGDIAIQEMLTARMTLLKALPESHFDKLYAAYVDGDQALAHFFNVDFDDDGVIFIANGKEGAGHAPARFLATSCVSEISRRLFG
jgi:hypothetical protein